MEGVAPWIKMRAERLEAERLAKLDAALSELSLMEAIKRSEALKASAGNDHGLSKRQVIHGWWKQPCLDSPNLSP